MTSSVLIGTVVAVEVQAEDMPDTVYAESDLTASFELTQLYTRYDEWTLKARTLLSLPDGSPGAEWTIEKYASDGTKVDTQTMSVETAQITVGNQDEARIVIEAAGTVPLIDNYETFDSLLLFEVIEVGPDGDESTLQSWFAEYKVNGTPTPDSRTDVSTQTAAVGSTSTQSEITEEESTQTPTGAEASSPDAQERQRGFLSNKGDEPDFLSNPFNLTTLGFLLSVAGIIQQMMSGD